MGNRVICYTYVLVIHGFDCAQCNGSDPFFDPYQEAVFGFFRSVWVVFRWSEVVFRWSEVDFDLNGTRDEV